MMHQRFEDLFEAYVAELRGSMTTAEAWWQQLIDDESVRQKATAELTPAERWPFGPGSHPWVIATYRKYYFLCKQLNEELAREAQVTTRDEETEGLWGSESEEQKPTREVEPKVFVLDLLEGGDTEDLFQFLLSMVFVPIGMKNEESV
jgi:hypothetical protein